MTKEDYIKLSTLLMNEAREKNIKTPISANVRKALPVVFRKVYEWGSYDAWSLSGGINRHLMDSIKILEELGYLGKMWKEYHVTDKAMSLVERENLFADLDDVQETGTEAR